MVGLTDRESGEVAAQAFEKTDRVTLQGFVVDHVQHGATVYTDDATAYGGLRFDHEAVQHSVGKFVRDMAHTNGIESFRRLFRRGYQGIYDKISSKHLDRYMTEFAHRYNTRNSDTGEQM